MRWRTYLTLLCLALIKLARCNAKQTRAKRTIIGYYPLCPRGCTSCSRLNGCLTCRPRFFLLLKREGIRQTGACLPHCPPGYYATLTKAFGKCVECPIANCDACYDRSYCARCVAPYLSNDGVCVLSCPAGQHYSTHTRRCQTRVNCMLSDWSAWSTCRRNGQICGYKYGLRTRSRAIRQHPSPNGERCSVTTHSYRCRLAFRSCDDLAHNVSDPNQKPTHRKTRRRRKKRRKRKYRKFNKKRRRRKWRRLRRRWKRKRLNREDAGINEPHLTHNTFPER